MTYEQAVDYIHSLLAFGIKPGLTRIKALLKALGDPQRGLRFVHVAGTNGKGSTCTMLSHILTQAGFQTGLFTSPYVFSFCERIQINNQNIPKSDLAEVVGQVKDAIDRLHTEGIEPTEFEAITAAAFLYFQKKRCDYVVLEVGLGGRFDATNCIPCPEVSVITSISLDHTAILGDTVEQIAAEKAGIIKENGITVTTSAQDPAALKVLYETAQKRGNRFVLGRVEAAEILSQTVENTVFTYAGEAYTLPLIGAHQIENAVGVIEAAKCLSGVSDGDIREGIRRTVLRGRMEFRKEPVPMLLDGGHNPECGEALAKVLARFAPLHVTAVIGMMRDKDAARYLRAVLPYCETVYFTKPQNPRAADPETLRNLAQGMTAQAYVELDPAKALRRACQGVSADGLLLICGSFYLLSDLEIDSGLYL